MSNHVLFAGLLLLSLGVVGIVYLNGVIQDVYCREAVVGVDFIGVDSTGMALRYTAHQLLNLKWYFVLGKDTRMRCGAVGILRPKRYFHRSSRSRSNILLTSTNYVTHPTILRKPRKIPWRPTGVNLNNLVAVRRNETSSDSPAPTCLLKLMLINVRSINNKASFLADIITDYNLDIICLTETWHKESDGLLFNELTPNGYGLCDSPRSSGRGGGIIVLYKHPQNLFPVAVPQFQSLKVLF